MHQLTRKAIPVACCKGFIYDLSLCKSCHIKQRSININIHKLIQSFQETTDNLVEIRLTMRQLVMKQRKKTWLGEFKDSFHVLNMT